MLTQDQIKRLFAGHADPSCTNGTPDSPWYVHAAMPWENIRQHFAARLTDHMVSVSEPQWDGLRPGEYDAEVEVRCRLSLMLSNERLEKRVVELSNWNTRLQRENVRLMGWGTE